MSSAICIKNNGSIKSLSINFDVRNIEGLLILHIHASTAYSIFESMDLIKIASKAASSEFD
ncbi:MAG TPA: hypothetical protein DEV38_02345 [Psychrobacter sp.]|nr:hypothetical protein [Psychrobacter sp.]